MNLAERLKTVLPVCLGILLVDQLSKSWAIATLKGRPVAEYLGGVFRVQYSENPGAFLSLGAALSSDARFWLLNVAVGLGLTACLIYLLRAKRVSPIHLYGFSLLFSGGLSNLGDRTLRTGGAVVDFLNVGLGGLRTGIFNIADMAIMAGVIMVAWPRPEPGSHASASSANPS